MLQPWDEPAEPHEETHWDPQVEAARRRVAATGQLAVILVSHLGRAREGGAAALFEASPDAHARVIWIPACPADLEAWAPVIKDLHGSGLEQQFELGAVSELGIEASLAAEELLVELGAQIGSGSWIALLPPAEPPSPGDLAPPPVTPRPVYPPPEAAPIDRAMVWLSLGPIALATIPVGILARMAA